MIARELEPWRRELADLLDRAGTIGHVELIQSIRELGVRMGHEAGDALLDAHPEFFAWSPVVTKAFADTIHDQDRAELKRLLALDIDGGRTFRDAASETTSIGLLSSRKAYERLDPILALLDLSRCRRIVMVGCGRRPHTLFRLHDEAPRAEAIGLDISEEEVEVANVLCARLGYERARAVLRDGVDYDYAGADLIYVASMVAPKGPVIRRIADTAPDDVQLVLWEGRSLSRLWCESGERALDPRFEIVARTPVTAHMSHDLLVRRRG